LPYGQSQRVSVTIPPEFGAGWFRLHGTYFFGCTSGAQVGPATCAGPIDIHVDLGIKAR